MGVSEKAKYLDGSDAHQPLLGPQAQGYDASSSAPTAPPLPTSTLAGPVVSFQDQAPTSLSVPQVPQLNPELSKTLM